MRWLAGIFLLLLRMLSSLHITQSVIYRFAYTMENDLICLLPLCNPLLFAYLLWKSCNNTWQQKNLSLRNIVFKLHIFKFTLFPLYLYCTTHHIFSQKNAKKKYYAWLIDMSEYNIICCLQYHYRSDLGSLWHRAGSRCSSQF